MFSLVIGPRRARAAPPWRAAGNSWRPAAVPGGVGAHRRLPVDIVVDRGERHLDVTPAERLELPLNQQHVLVGWHVLSSRCPCHSLCPCHKPAMVRWRGLSPCNPSSPGGVTHTPAA